MSFLHVLWKVFFRLKCWKAFSTQFFKYSATQSSFPFHSVFLFRHFHYCRTNNTTTFWELVLSFVPHTIALISHVCSRFPDKSIPFDGPHLYIDSSSTLHDLRLLKAAVRCQGWTVLWQQAQIYRLLVSYCQWKIFMLHFLGLWNFLELCIFTPCRL